MNKFSILIILFFIYSLPALSQDKIPILYFYEADCPDCAKINQMVMPGFIAKYGSKVKLIKRNVDEMKNFEAMMAFEVTYKIPPQEVPEFYTAFGVSWKPDKIASELPRLIEQEFNSKQPGKYAAFFNNYLKTGKTGISVVEAIQKQYTSSLDSQHANSKNKTGNVLRSENANYLKIYEFRKPGCRSCNRLSLSLKYLQKKFPMRLKLKTYNIKDNKAKILNEAFCIKYHVAENLHMATPALFFGEKAIIGESAFKNMNIVSPVVQALQEAGQFPTPEISDADLKAAEEAIYKRFDAISWTAVLFAGLLDGVNPCAFVTIIFLLSYLALMKYSKKDIALVGVSFTLAVFFTYLAIGLGFLQFVSYIQGIPYLNEVIYYAAIAFAAIIGILNLSDYIKIKKGSLENMDLKLSDSLRQRINAVIRKNVKLRHFLIGAFGMGFAISLLELACTGQVYLPTVLFIINTQGMQFRAVLLLIAYNLAFILPLMVIFVTFWHGTTEKRMSQLLAEHGANIKLAMGLLFIALATFLYFFK